MSDVLIAVPARYGSSRLPGKIVKILAGKPVIQRTYEKCLQAAVGDVIIATEAQIVADTCARFGAKAILTSAPAKAVRTAFTRPPKAVRNNLLSMCKGTSRL